MVDASTWEVTDEFGQRLGCGLLTAFILPPWFLLAVFAASDNALAWAFAVVVFVAATGLAVAGRWRIRRLPQRIELVDEDGGPALLLCARTGERRVPLAGLREIRATTSIGLLPVVLVLADGSRVRVPRDLEDFDGFTAALVAVCPGVRVVDRNDPSVGEGST